MDSPLAIILAAGRGTRMGSDLPKVLHPLAGEPLIVHPLRAAAAAGAREVVVVVGYGAGAVREAVKEASPRARFAEQIEQLGTGHAVLCALPAIEGHAGPTLILSGDVPLLQAATLGRLVDAARESSAGLAVATFEPPSPTGYGRILRDAWGAMIGVREERDASAVERAIRECNAGVYCADAELLRRELPLLGRENAQGEIYLTDLVARAASQGEVATVRVDAEEVAGVNTPEQLAELALRIHETPVHWRR
jgi:UDP-N-acetylglucosamine diphosphorylase/glucosamine-1-phosphate N-acetyltransferase